MSEPESDGGKTFRKVDEAAVKVNTAKAELLATGKFSDFTLQCSTAVSDTIFSFKIHRAVVFGHSPYFDKLMDGKFKESCEQTALVDADPAVVAAALWFIYTGDYLMFAENMASAFPFINRALYNNLFTAHLEIFEAADRLMFPKLQKMARITVISIFKMAQNDGNLIENKDLHDLLDKLYRKDYYKLDESKELIEWLAISGLALTRTSDLDKIPKIFLCRVFELSETMRCQNFHCRCSECGSTMKAFDTFARPLMSKEWLVCSCFFRGLCSQECSKEKVGEFEWYCGSCYLNERGCDMSRFRN